jgi:hypothetical protein
VGKGVGKGATKGVGKVMSRLSHIVLPHSVQSPVQSPARPQTDKRIMSKAEARSRSQSALGRRRVSVTSMQLVRGCASNRGGHLLVELLRAHNVPNLHGQGVGEIMRIFKSLLVPVRDSGSR